MGSSGNCLTCLKDNWFSDLSLRSASASSSGALARMWDVGFLDYKGLKTLLIIINKNK